MTLPASIRFTSVFLLMLILFQSLSYAQNRTFSVRSRLFPVGPNPSAIVVHDMNDNGILDIITADRGELVDVREERPANDELSLLVGQGDLNYIKHHPSLKTGFAPYAIAIANIDAIRWPDIIVTSFHAVRGRHISLFLNLHHENVFQPVNISIPEDGLGYYRHLDSDHSPLFTKPGLTSLAVRDINNDGYRDIIATGWSSDVIVYLPGQADNFFGEPSFISARGGPRDLQLADLNGNGHLDIVSTLYSSDEVAFWQGDGRGNFTKTNRFQTRGRLPNKVRVADMNGNGRLDIIIGHRHTDDSIVIFYNDGNMQFSTSQEIMLGTDREILEHDIRDIVIADLDNNGRMDIAAACSASAKIVILLNQTSGNNGGITVRREDYSFPEGTPHALAAGDLNNNGRIDLAVTLWDVNAVGILINQGQ